MCFVSIIIPEQLSELAVNENLKRFVFLTSLEVDQQFSPE